MKRNITFKLLSQLEPVTIKSDATTVAQLANEITNHEVLSNLIEISPRIEGTSKTYVVLVDGKTGQEYSFDNPADTLPSKDVLFYVTPVTSKFGVDVSSEEEGDSETITLTTKEFEITIKVRKTSSQPDSPAPKFTEEELKEMHETAMELMNKLNRRVNNLPVD